MRRLLPLALALALGGCSLLPSMESDPFDASVAVHSWQLEGKMTFRCDYDEQGFFWRFVSQSGTLTNENRETVATLSGNLRLTHRDGSSVSAHVEKSLSPATSRNAGDVRYIVDRSAASGALRGVRYLTRIRTTGELAKIAEESIPAKFRQNGPCARKTFQAIRIEVNGELDGLEEAVKGLSRRLKKGGRICILTFHSLEDRIVKNAFRELATDCICDKSLPVCVCGKKKEIEIITHKPLTASAEELQNNSRAKSAKLRIAERV